MHTFEGTRPGDLLRLTRRAAEVPRWARHDPGEIVRVLRVWRRDDGTVFSPADRAYVVTTRTKSADVPRGVIPPNYQEFQVNPWEVEQA